MATLHAALYSILMTSGRKYYVGLLVTFLGACLWGLSGVCIQHLHEAYALDSLTITCVRSITASVLFLLILFVRYSAELRRLMSHRRDAFVVVLFGDALFASQATYAVSTGLTNAGTATVLQMLGSVFVLIIACVRFKRHPKAIEVVAILLALTATWLIATKGNPLALMIPLAGLIWGLVNALSEAAYLVIPEQQYSRYARIVVIGCGIAVSAVIALVFYLCASCLGVASEAQARLLNIDAFGWVVLIGGVGVLGTFAAFGMYLWGSSHIGPVKGSLLGVAEPASACILSAVLLGTSFAGADWLGLVLMIAMLVIMSRTQQINQAVLRRGQGRWF